MGNHKGYSVFRVEESMGGIFCLKSFLNPRAKKMMHKDLTKILKEIPILMVPVIAVQRNSGTWTAEGMAIQKMRDDGSVMKYTVINYNCDDVARGLLHESIHHYYGGTDEWYVKQVENLMWKKSEFRKPCQNKIIELCGEYKL